MQKPDCGGSRVFYEKERVWKEFICLTTLILKN